MKEFITIIGPSNNWISFFSLLIGSGYSNKQIGNVFYRISFKDAIDKIIYEYDFGDGWEHEVEFEGYFERIKGNKYPCCLAGEIACLPEDVWGISGYYDFVGVMNDKEHPEYESAIEWYGGKFDSRLFDASQIKFHNAKSKLRKILD